MSLVFREENDRFVKNVHFFGVFGLIAIAITLNSAHAFAASKDNGKTVFHDNCSTCHGENGTADTPVGKQLKAKNLQSVEVQNLSDQKLLFVIKNGSGAMPKFKDGLSDEEIHDVIAYIRILGKTNQNK